MHTQTLRPNALAKTCPTVRTRQSVLGSLIIFWLCAFLLLMQTVLLGQETSSIESSSAWSTTASESSSNENQPRVDLTGIKCIVSGIKNASPEHAVAHKQGTVYFSSASAAGLFRAMTDGKRVPEKQAGRSKTLQQQRDQLLTRANHQLALTGQYRQRRCPVTYRRLEPTVALQLGGVSIGFADPESREIVRSQPNLIRRASLVFQDGQFDDLFVYRPTVANHQHLLTAKALPVAKRQSAQTQSAQTQSAQTQSARLNATQRNETRSRQ